MSGLIEFIPAQDWQEHIYINPDDVSFIRRKHFDRNMGEYSTIAMRNGEMIDVNGLPSAVAKIIRDHRSDSDDKSG